MTFVFTPLNARTSHMKEEEEGRDDEEAVGCWMSNLAVRRTKSEDAIIFIIEWERACIEIQRMQRKCSVQTTYKYSIHSEKKRKWVECCGVGVMNANVCHFQDDRYKHSNYEKAQSKCYWSCLGSALISFKAEFSTELITAIFNHRSHAGVGQLCAQDNYWKIEIFGIETHSLIDSLPLKYAICIFCILSRTFSISFIARDCYYRYEGHFTTLPHIPHHGVCQYGVLKLFTLLVGIDIHNNFKETPPYC